MKNVLFSAIMICLGTVTGLTAQKIPLRPGCDIRIINNEVIEYQQGGIINWTRGYLRGTGKMSVNTPACETGAMLMAQANLRALYSKVRIVDTLTLSTMAIQSTIFRSVYRLLNTGGRWESISQGMLSEDTLVVYATVDFNTLLNFHAQDQSLKEWIFENYLVPKSGERFIIDDPDKGIAMQEVRSFEDLRKKLPASFIAGDDYPFKADSMIIALVDQDGSDQRDFHIASPSVFRKILIRLNDSLYDYHSGMKLGRMVPVKWIPTVEKLAERIRKSVRNNTELPGVLKAEPLADGSLLVDLDKILDRKVKLEKVFDVLLTVGEIAIAILPLVL